MSALGSLVDRALARGTADTQSVPDVQTSLSADDVHRLLANDRRRYVIRQIADRSWTHDDLALALAAHETDQDPRQVDSQERKRAYVGLYQVHLPHLDGLGVIDWTPSGGRVHQGPEYDGVYAALLAAGEHIADQGGDD